MTAPRHAASSRRSRASEPAAPASIQRPETSDQVGPLPPLPRGATAGGGPDESVFDGQYRIKLDAFEGPLDLLLHLIQQHELDILDIPVSFITAKYLEYLKMMQVLSIEIASEYLVMAATLVHIKSKMLLPVMPTGQDDGMPQEEEEDPRAELVRRLLEYQKYKAAAALLAERGTLGRDVFARGVEEEAAPGPATFARVEVFGLLEAFEKVLKRAKVKIDHEVVFDRISITDRIVELTEKLEGRRAVRFEWLFLSMGRAGVVTRFDLVITFLAMLEMCRMRLLRVYQTGPLAPIYMGIVENELTELTDEERSEADHDADLKLAEAPVVAEAVASDVAATPAAADVPAVVEEAVVEEAVASEASAAAVVDEAVVIDEPVVVDEVVAGEQRDVPVVSEPVDQTGAELPPSEDEVSELPNEDGADDVGLETFADHGDETVTEFARADLDLEGESEPDRETMPMPPPVDTESERATIPVEPPAEHAPAMAVHIPPNPAWMPGPEMLPAGPDDAPTPPDEVTDDG